MQSSVFQFVLYHKHYPLGDIRGMVGNALHIFGNHQIVNILGYILRFLLHYSSQMLTHFGKVIVYLIIGSNNLIGQLQIILADGADAVVHHLAHNL